MNGMKDIRKTPSCLHAFAVIFCSSGQLVPAQTPPSAHPKNAPGDFYVAAECCKLCGIPRKIAPDLFASDDKACWVSRQPVTPSDYKKMLQVMDSQEFTCVRYRGTDPSVRLVAPSEAVDPRDS